MRLAILYVTADGRACPCCGGETKRIETRGYFARGGIVKEHSQCVRCGIRTLAYRPGELPIIFGWIRTTKGKR